MEAQKPAVTPPTLVENLNAPEVFSDWAHFFSIGQGVIKITFVSNRADAGKRSDVVIGRLTMPINGAQGLASGLYDFLKKNGLDPNPAPPSDKLQ